MGCHFVVLNTDLKLRLKLSLIKRKQVHKWLILELMDSLQDILGARGDFKPPDEFKAVRDYVLRRYKSNCYVKIQRDSLIITVRSSALAATIQLERQRLIESCHLTKKLVIRAGSAG